MGSQFENERRDHVSICKLKIHNHGGVRKSRICNHGGSKTIVLPPQPLVIFKWNSPHLLEVRSCHLDKSGYTNMCVLNSRGKGVNFEVSKGPWN